ncbi:M67 family metallopeptidase [Endozoicomonas sp. SM1973]|uniref:M67 family metallopeptidase n=1 Tax=Spartinivicinus marinus TaxID=2994442 RepID=A0A853HXQ4_9GAMM|nr:M67 family metallopeptidase [Spartinivicinus marinus]MCX4024827.1 M67 family metallopeptidase [Spartinivicinus marinus]NYZ66530.1 M67 family metallopeptidase [Spartinivicinus marinus]
MTIYITTEINHAMLNHAQQRYPSESCGLIIGHWQASYTTSCYYYPCNNQITANSQRRFLIDPVVYQEAEDNADQQGLSIISIVHSHPDHPDEPSEFDRQHAWPGISYIIISVVNGKIASYRSWQLTNNRNQFLPETIQVDGNTHASNY